VQSVRRVLFSGVAHHRSRTALQHLVGKAVQHRHVDGRRFACRHRTERAGRQGLKAFMATVDALQRLCIGQSRLWGRSRFTRWFGAAVAFLFCRQRHVCHERINRRLALGAAR
jgi:hypothetical protein